DPELFPRIQPARHIKPKHSVQKRHAGANSAHRPADLSHFAPIADPAEIAEQGGPHADVVRSKLGARQPERVAALRRVRTLAAHGLRSAEEPTPLTRQRAE